MRNSKGNKEYLHPLKQVNPKVIKCDFKNLNIISNVKKTTSHFGNLVPQILGFDCYYYLEDCFKSNLLFIWRNID